MGAAHNHKTTLSPISIKRTLVLTIPISHESYFESCLKYRDYISIYHEQCTYRMIHYLFYQYSWCRLPKHILWACWREHVARSRAYARIASTCWDVRWESLRASVIEPTDSSKTQRDTSVKLSLSHCVQENLSTAWKTIFPNVPQSKNNLACLRAWIKYVRFE